MVTRDGREVRLTPGNWIAMVSLVATVVLAMVGSAAKLSGTLSEINVTIRSHEVRIQALERAEQRFKE